MTEVPSLAARARKTVAALRRLGSQRNRDGMARYAIPSHRVGRDALRDLTRAPVAARLGRDSRPEQRRP